METKYYCSFIANIYGLGRYYRLPVHPESKIYNIYANGGYKPVVVDAEFEELLIAIIKLRMNPEYTSQRRFSLFMEYFSEDMSKYEGKMFTIVIEYTEAVIRNVEEYKETHLDEIDKKFKDSKYLSIGEYHISDEKGNEMIYNSDILFKYLGGKLIYPLYYPSYENAYTRYAEHRGDIRDHYSLIYDYHYWTKCSAILS